MNGVQLSADLIGLIVATFLTLCVASYLLGDNFLYRLAVAILVGSGAAFIFAVALFNIIIPRVVIPILQGREANPVVWVFAMMGMLLGALMLSKWSAQLAWMGNFSIAYLVGVGVGVAIGGVALGTLFTQSQAAAKLDSFDSLIMLVVTLAVFISFTFLLGKRRGLTGLYTNVLKGVSTVGRSFLAVAFGIVFASAYIASVSVLISRIQSIVEAIRQIVALLGV